MALSDETHQLIANANVAFEKHLNARVKFERLRIDQADAERWETEARLELLASPADASTEVRLELTDNYIRAHQAVPSAESLWRDLDQACTRSWQEYRDALGLALTALTAEVGLTYKLRGLPADAEEIRKRLYGP